LKCISFFNGELKCDPPAIGLSFIDLNSSSAGAVIVDAEHPPVAKNLRESRQDVSHSSHGFLPESAIEYGNPGCS